MTVETVFSAALEQLHRSQRAIRNAHDYVHNGILHIEVTDESETVTGEWCRGRSATGKTVTGVFFGEPQVASEPDFDRAWKERE